MKGEDGEGHLKGEDGEGHLKGEDGEGHLKGEDREGHLIEKETVLIGNKISTLAYFQRFNKGLI